MTNTERETQIKALGETMQSEMDLAVVTGNCYFMHRGNADAARLSMESLIKQRPAEYVQALEIARGLNA